MNLSFLVRPKWKDPDPAVRVAAVARLKDEDVLFEIAQHDTDCGVRTAALQRISDPHCLADIALGKSEMALPALDRLQDQDLLARVAERAESPEVRGRAVLRVRDPRVVHRIATQDTNAAVRTQARMRIAGPDSLRHFLKSVLTRLEVARERAGAAAEFCANLDGVCDALAADPRFRVRGVVGDIRESNGGAAPSPESSTVELLGDPEGGTEGDATRSSSYYRIAVCRTGEDAFDLNVKRCQAPPPG